MATKIVIKNGVVHSVYDDRLREFMEKAFGIQPADIKRASEVEMDLATGEWVATLIGTGQEIARGKNRGDVIQQEVAYLEAHF